VTKRLHLIFFTRHLSNARTTFCAPFRPHALLLRVRLIDSSPEAGVLVGIPERLRLGKAQLVRDRDGESVQEKSQGSGSIICTPHFSKTCPVSAGSVQSRVIKMTSYSAVVKPLGGRKQLLPTSTKPLTTCPASTPPLLSHFR